MRILFGIAMMAVALDAAPASRSSTVTARPSQAINAPHRFRAVAVYPQGIDSEARIRTLSGNGWSDWITVSREHSDSGAFLFLDIPQTAIVVDRPARVLFIDPGESAPTTASAEPPTAPGYVSRADWGCSPERCYFRGGSPATSTVTHLVVHHTAGSNAASDWAAVVRAIWEFHVNGNGWSDIGYNWLIAPDGVLYEGRQGGDGVIGAHFSGVNTNTMGVSLMGTFSEIAPPARIIDTLRSLLAFHAAKWKLDPSGDSVHAPSGLRLNVISGHRDAGLSPRASGATECPGNGVYVLLQRLRGEVASLLSDSLHSLRVPQSVCVPADGGTLDLGLDSGSATAGWLQPSGTSVQVAANTGPRREADLRAGWKIVRVVQAGVGQANLPCVASRGVMAAGSGVATPVAPGSLISIYGSGLATESSTPNVVVNGSRSLPLLYAGPNQINAQLPFGIATGSARLTVTVDGVASADVLFWISEANPVLFAAAPATDGVARPGSTLVVYLTGVGAVDGTAPGPGVPTPTDRLYNARAPWTATLGTWPMGKAFLGLTPGFFGLYQANVTIPADLPPGDYPLTLTVAGATSNALPVSVQ